VPRDAPYLTEIENPGVEAGVQLHGTLGECSYALYSVLRHCMKVRLVAFWGDARACQGREAPIQSSTAVS
jgi:hypothetical protein